MTRLRRWVVIAGLAVTMVASQLSVAAPAHAGWRDQIASLDVSYQIQPDGDVSVTQIIDYEFGAPGRPGIELDVLTREPWDSSRDALYPVDDVQVESPTGAAVRVSQRMVQDEDGVAQMRLRIGDPAHPTDLRETYVVRYTLSDATQAQPAYDEFVRDVSSGGFDAPVARARVQVTAPGGAQNVRCSLDKQGEVPCGNAQITRQAAEFEGRNLAPSDRFIVAVMLTPGAVTDPGPRLEDRPEPVGRSLFIGGLGMLAATALMGIVVLVVRRRFAGRPPPAPPRWQAPESEVELVIPDVPPAEASILASGVFAPRHTAAILIDLAVRGALTIGPAAAREASLTITDPTPIRDGYERALIERLFGRVEVGSTVTIGPRRPIVEMSDAVQRAVCSVVTERHWFAARPVLFTASASVGLLAVTATVLTVCGLIVPGATSVHLGRALIGGLTLLPVIALGLWLWRWARWPRPTESGAAVRDEVESFWNDLAALAAEQVVPGSDTLVACLPWAICADDTERWASVTQEAITLGRVADATPAWWRGSGYSPFAVIPVVRAIELAAAGPERVGQALGSASGRS